MSRRSPCLLILALSAFLLLERASASDLGALLNSRTDRAQSALVAAQKLFEDRQRELDDAKLQLTEAQKKFDAEQDEEQRQLLKIAVGTKQRLVDQLTGPFNEAEAKLREAEAAVKAAKEAPPIQPLYFNARGESGGALVVLLNRQALDSMDVQLQTTVWFVRSDGEVLADDQLVSHDDYVVVPAQYVKAGQYTISLLAIDAAKKKYSATATINVQAPAPVSGGGAPQLATLASATPNVENPSESEQKFREKLRKHVVDIGLHTQDDLFNRHRVQIAGAITKAVTDPAIVSIADRDKQIAAMQEAAGPRVIEILTGDNSPPEVVALWRRFLENAVRFAVQTDSRVIPVRKEEATADDYRKFWLLMADELGSKELSDDALTATVAKYLRERGFTAQPISGATSGGGYRRHRLFQHP